MDTGPLITLAEVFFNYVQSQERGTAPDRSMKPECDKAR